MSREPLSKQAPTTSAKTGRRPASHAAAWAPPAPTTPAPLLLPLLLLLLAAAAAGRAQQAGGQLDGAPGAQAGSGGAQEPQAAATSSGSCFGGLQTFEKISMSAFESPGGQGAGAGSFGAGILVQQDDQALTSECVNLCRSQANCMSFVIDYNKFECKSYATTQQELQQEFEARSQAARSANLNNNNNTTTNKPANQSSSPLDSIVYHAAASNVHFQQLLPSTSSNYFEKICLDGIANRNQFGEVCGQARLWTVERVVDSFLDGYVEKELTNVNNKDECSKLCIFESQFVCRSADYDQSARLCRLSKEDRRSQPQAMRHLANSGRQYLENQCATPGPSSCVYETKKNQAIISMDALKFAQSVQDCQMRCNQEASFNCRSYSFFQKRCFLSADDSTSLNNNLIKLPAKQGWLFGEKRCLVELCSKGIFSYERISGYTLKSALATPIELMAAAGSGPQASLVALPEELAALERLQAEPSAQQQLYAAAAAAAAGNSSIVSTMMMVAANREPLDEGASAPAAARQQQQQQLRPPASNLAITAQCRHSCDLGYLNCPAYTIDYKNNRCQRLDRNSQGRHLELVPREGFAYYEKICLRVPEIMSMCQDKYWIFERVIGHELAPRLYEKALKFVQSRRDCQEYCLEERQFQCRSALYNDETSDCKLSRYDRRLALAENGFYRNFNPRISYLENQCIRNQEADRKQCFYEQTKEEPSYPTYTEHIEMLPSLPAPMSAGSQVERESSPATNTSGRSGALYCEQLCNDNTKFECHSFGYYASTAQCFLSGDDSVSAGDSSSRSSTGFTYFEKKCRLATAGLATRPAGDHNNSTPDPIRVTEPTRPDQSFDPYAGPALHNNNNNTRTTTTMGSYDGPAPPTPPAGPSTQAPQLSSLAPHSSSLGPAYEPPARPPAYEASPRPPSYEGSSRPPLGATTGSDSSLGANPDEYKCGLGHTFAYQRVSGFEPIGGYLTLLVRDNEAPGVVAECAELCKKAFECRAFVVDYENNQCFAMLENSSVGMLNLRQAIGKDYFEGFCVSEHLLRAGASNCANKTWLVDKIVDQAALGVQHHKALQVSERAQCRQACLEERMFACKSAMFEASSGECKLYSIERESLAQMRLVFTKGVDFFENQCQIVTSSCPYDAIERDTTIVTATKSLQARSTFDCEHACNIELAFNCRAYTYLDQYPSLPNLCVLSSDSRSTSQRGSVRERSRSLFAERNCYFRRARQPSAPAGRRGSQQPEAAGYGVAAIRPSAMEAETGAGDPYSAAGPRFKEPSAMMVPTPHSDAYQPYQQPAQPPPPPSTMADSALEHNNGSLEPLPAGQLAPGEASCEPHQFTFERTHGFDFRSASGRERAPIAPTVGIVVGCQQECLKRGPRCQAFVVEYALPYQGCFLLDTQVGANKRLLVRSANAAYFEKLCLPKTGVAEASSTPASSSASAAGNHDWTSHVPDQLPYYLQHQQLVQNYPSRLCAKLWSFERFVNHNFTGQPDRVASEVLSRAQCETLCLNEAGFSCRAATYDYPNRMCRLFRNTRRTLMSQFVDLDLQTTPGQSMASAGSSMATEQPQGATSGQPTMPQDQHLSSGSARVVLAHDDLMQGSHSAGQATYLVGPQRQTSGRQLMMPTSGASSSNAEPLDPSRNIDYLENSCAPEPSSCQYRQIYDMFSLYIDKLNHAVSLSDCQRQCDLERLFGCKAINYDPGTRSCMLLNEDLVSLNRQAGPLVAKKNTIYSEKGNCEMISVQCNSQEMLVSINFDAPFRGRVMAKGNPEQCYLIGDGQTSLQFPIQFGPKCNSRQEGHNTFVNEVVVQQHPIIMTDSDKTVRVMCAFEAPDQTITLKSPGARDNRTGIDVGAPESGRTRQDKQQFNSVVSNKAPPPSVLLRILDPSGRDASMINLGDDLTLKIQMQLDGQNSALGIFARNLAARSSNGESLLLIDQDGCPVDHQVFPGLEVDPRDGKSLLSTFKAFRFPSSGLVNFEVQIRFCPERCQPVDCGQRAGSARLKSYGRRRRRKRHVSGEPATSSLHDSRTMSIFQSASGDLVGPLESLSTPMKPGRAFQYVKELMFAPKAAENPPGDLAEVSEPTQATNVASNEPLQPTSPAETVADTSAPSSDTTQPSGPLPDSVQPTPADEEFLIGAGAPLTESPGLATPEAQPSSEGRPLAADLHGSYQKSILMHVDERVVPPTGFGLPRPPGLHQHPQAPHSPAPYSGRFPLNGLEFHRKQQSDLATSAPPIGLEQPEVRPSTQANNSAQQEGSETHSSTVPEDGQQAPEVAEQPFAVGSKKEDERNEVSSQSTVVSDRARDLPLRFSILVGDSDSQRAPSISGWRSSTPAPGASAKNSSSLELDHIVVAGRDGQLSPGGEPSAGMSGATSEAGLQLSAPPEQSSPTDSPKTRRPQSQEHLELAGKHLIGYPDSTGAEDSANGRDRFQLEQTFDALPSNPAEVKVGQGPRQQRQQPVESAAAASQDCQFEASSGRLRTIIWTGTIVIGLNISLVVVALLLYFKRTHLRKDVNIVRAFSQCSSQPPSERRWPSVMLKSSSNLGHTSLNTHDQFFYKLNSKHQGMPAAAAASQPMSANAAGPRADFQWPNLSSSSSHSTISSMAGQMSAATATGAPRRSPNNTSITAINQSRSLKQIFDTQPTPTRHDVHQPM